MRYRFVTACLAACLGLGTALAGFAAPVEGLFEATVAGDSTEAGRLAAAADALRQVAVRLTGRSAAASDPALLGLYQEAPKFVQTFRSVASGQVAVTFEPGLVETALARAGQRFWGKERPQILVVFDGAPAAQSSARRDMTQAGQLRGVPLAFAETKIEPPADVRDGKPDALRAMAKTFGADGAILVHLGSGTPSGVWVGPAGEGSSSGSIAEIVDAMADRLGVALSISAADSGRLVAVIHGVSDLKSFVEVQARLAALPAVRGLVVDGVAGATVRLKVVGIADAASLRKAARDSGRFDAPESNSTREIDLVFKP